MDEPVTSSTPDTTPTALGPAPRSLPEEDEEDEISAMQRSIQEDLPAESEGEGAGHRTSIDSVDEIRQYIVYVEDDGSILLDKTGIMPEDADPSCVIPLRLPVNKLADPEDPLPGAIHMSYRKTTEALTKTELQTLMYNADTDEVIGGATRLEEGDLEWVQFDPKSVKEEDAQVLSEEIKEESASGPELIPEPEPTVTTAATTDPTPVALPDPVATPVAVPATSPSVTSAAKRASETKSAQATASATSARARRSLRQADRAEKQEAERILAENKQMLQREKEEMENLKPKLPLNTVTPSGHIVGISPPIKKEVKEQKEMVEDSTKKNPKRTRKLPAHLTDPNYIHPLDDQSEDPDLKFLQEADEPEAEAEAEAAEGDDVDVDDPNKLWCICRRPHNNRFMIQCDSCEDWFHGKCVGVTKAQGKVIEESEMQWHCPTCKKKVKEQEARNRLADKKAKASGRTPENVKGARNSTSSRENDSARDKKGDQVPRRPSTFSPDITAIPVRKDKSSTVTQKKDDPAKKGKSGKSEAICIVCGNVARDGSEFCSNKCVMEKAKMNTPEEQEKKRELEKKDSTGDSFLSFHKLKAPKKEDDVVSSSTERSSKSPAVKPAESNTKSGTPRQTPRDSPLAKDAAKGSTPQKLPSSAAELKKERRDSSLPVTPTDKVKKRPEDAERVRKTRESQEKEKLQTGKLKEALTQDAKGSAQKVPLQKQKSVEERNSQSQKPSQQKVSESQQRDSNRKTGDGKARDSAKISTGTPQKSGNQLVRSTSKQDDEKSRDEQKAKKPTSEQKSTSQKSKDERSSQQKPPLERKKSDTSSLNSEPLLRQNMKRSLQAILQEKLKEAKASDGTIEFKANPETLAVEIEQELINLFGTAGNPKCKAKFRSLLFNLKNTRSTLATNLLTLTLPPSQLVRMDSSEMAPQELTEWRQRESQRELEAIKRSELDKLTEAKKQELIEKGAEMDVVGKVAVAARQELEGVIPEPEDGKTEQGTSDEKNEDKEKSKSKKKKHHRDRKHHHHRDRQEASASSSRDKKPEEKEKAEDKSLKRSSSVLSEEPKAVWPELPSKEKYEAQFPLTSPRELSPSLPELPSSTVKTPDFSPPQTTSLSPLFKTKLVMPELGSLNASAFHVSHPQLEGILFPVSPVPIVGRISPETVWDYIDKMKKSKELIVLRLAPATPQDADAYMTFFSYLASRGRLGVLGGISPPLKDVYLVPLDKHSPVNRSLLPFHGPGLPTQRAHCLLAVVTRTIESGHRLRLEVRHAAAKKPKLEPKPEPPPAKNEDEDKPYEPWEGEEEEEEEDTVALELRRLNEQIAKAAKERQEIESILVATSRNVALAKVGGIPGLDGEFDDESPKEVERKQEPEVIEVKDDKVVETKPDEITIDEEEIKHNVAANEDDNKMEIDETSPSPVTLLDSPPTPEPPPPGIDDFRPLKKHSIEELSDEPFEGATLKQPLGKKIEINIKGVFKAAETSHGDIDERQAQPDPMANENVSSASASMQQSTSLSLTSKQPPGGSMQQIPLPLPPAEQPAVSINVSIPPPNPNPFYLPPSLPPVGLPPQSQPHQLPPRFPMMPVGGTLNERFPMPGQQQSPSIQQQPPMFPTNFPPPLMSVITGTFPSLQQGADQPSSSSGARADRFQSTERSEREPQEEHWDDGNGQRVPRNFSDSPRRNDSPRFGGAGYRHPRGDFHGRVHRNPGGDRGRRWEFDRRNNRGRARDRDRSPDRRDRQRRDSRDRSGSGSRRHRRHSRSSSARRRSRSPSPRRGSKSPQSRRRSKSPSSPRRGSKSASPKRRSASPRRKSISPRSRRRRSSSSSSSSSSSDSKK